MCSICIEHIDLGVITRCNHRFHQICLENWKEECKNHERDISCPVCRNNIGKTITITMDIVQWRSMRSSDYWSIGSNNIRGIQGLGKIVREIGFCAWFGVGVGVVLNIIKAKRH